MSYGSGGTGTEGNGGSEGRQNGPSGTVISNNTVKVTARMTQEPEHEMAMFLRPKRELRNETARADTGIGSGTLVAGIEIFTRPLKNDAGGRVMFIHY
jgi:hypothetical protein